MSTNEIAQTIRQQLGRKALFMLGAHSLVATERGLQFKIRGSKRCNLVQIELDPSDTYTVRFSKYTPMRVNRRTFEASPESDVEVSKTSDVYVDSLHTLIEKETGLYTKL